MPYADYDEIRAITGLSTTDLSSANLATIMIIADRIVDNHSEGNPSSNDKRDAANCFAASISFQNRSGTLTEGALIELKDAIKIDARTASILQQGLSKQFFERALYILSSKSATDLIQRVP